MAGIMLSYSRKDQDVVAALIRGFEVARREVWYDLDLDGGAPWWDSILHHIRTADVFVFALSDDSIASKPCQIELDYAFAVDRPVLPVQVGPFSATRTHPLATHQIIRYDPRDAESGFAVLAAADARAAQRRPLPDPLPDEPAVPYGYLMQAKRRIESSELSSEDQRAVLGQLHHALDEETEPGVRAEILATLRSLGSQQWTTNRTANWVRSLLLTYDTTPPAHERGPVALEVVDPREWFMERMLLLQRQREAHDQESPGAAPWPTGTRPDGGAPVPGPEGRSGTGSPRELWPGPAGPVSGRLGPDGPGHPGSAAGGPGARGSGSDGPGPGVGAAREPRSWAGGPGRGRPGPTAAEEAAAGAVGPGAVGPGAVGPGAAGPGAVGPGAVGPGAVGPGAVGPGEVASGTAGSGAPDFGRRPAPGSGADSRAGSGAAAPVWPGVPRSADPRLPPSPERAGPAPDRPLAGPASPAPTPSPVPVPSGAVPVHWPLSLVAFVLFLPVGGLLFGGVALWFSRQAGIRARAGDAPGARRSARDARIWATVGIVAGVLLYVVARPRF